MPFLPPNQQRQSTEGNSFGLYLQMSEKTEIGCIACTFVIIGVNYQLFAFKSLILNLVFNLEPDFKHEFKLNI